MVIHKVDIERLAVLEPEDDAPVGAHRDRSKTFEVAGQGMNSEGRQVQRLDLLRGLQNDQNLFELSHVVGIDPLRKVILEQLPQSLMPKAPNRSSSLEASVNYLFRCVNWLLTRPTDPAEARAAARVKGWKPKGRSRFAASSTTARPRGFARER
jgi:hypothetical protein